MCETAYLSLSPATFFTVLALLWAVYYVATSLFSSSDDHNHQRSGAFEEEQMEPLPPPVQLSEISEEELKQYDGSDSKKPPLKNERVDLISDDDDRTEIISSSAFASSPVECRGKREC